MSALPQAPNIRSGTLAMAAQGRKEQRGVECLQRSQAARLAASAQGRYFPLFGSARPYALKNTGERSTGADLPGTINFPAPGLLGVPRRFTTNE